ncbi:MAG: hypothetical protein FJ011_14600 [Chloroflexi bacterium]|nr:hypothetical protein [Chloroflexota bacterium]
MAFPGRLDYEALIYSLPGRYAAEITVSTLRLYSTSALTARVGGVVQFANGVELRVKEYLDFRLGRILDYSYTVYRGSERIRWYDPQPHAELSALSETFPHHRHEPPDIKHNRQPAPNISFTAPNLPALVADCLLLG